MIVSKRHTSTSQLNRSKNFATRSSKTKLKPIQSQPKLLRKYVPLTDRDVTNTDLLISDKLNRFGGLKKEFRSLTNRQETYDLLKGKILYFSHFQFVCWIFLVIYGLELMGYESRFIMGVRFEIL